MHLHGYAVKENKFNRNALNVTRFQHVYIILFCIFLHILEFEHIDAYLLQIFLLRIFLARLCKNKS